LQFNLLLLFCKTLQGACCWDYTTVPPRVNTLCEENPNALVGFSKGQELFLPIFFIPNLFSQSGGRMRVVSLFRKLEEGAG
jgi:hypothetical protein